MILILITGFAIGFTVSWALAVFNISKINFKHEQEIWNLKKNHTTALEKLENSWRTQK